MSKTKPRKLGQTNRFPIQGYLGKWASTNSLTGLLARFGSTSSHFMILLASNALLGGITFFSPLSQAREAPAPPAVNSRFMLSPIATGAGGPFGGALAYSFTPAFEGRGTDALLDVHRNRRSPIYRLNFAPVI